MNKCSTCGSPTLTGENEYGKFVCDDCEQNAAERAYERQQEGEPPVTQRERYVAAWEESRRLK